MTTASVRGLLGPGWIPKCGFAKLVGIWFGALLSLYAIYALIAFLGLEPRYPVSERAIMVLGPTMMAVALLGSAATFAASAIRFDLLTARDPKHRRLYRAQLALFGLGAYLLVAFGVPAARSMLPGAGDLPAEAFSPSASAFSGLRLLYPVPFGLFAVLSGVAGALVGRIVSRSLLKHAGAVPWLACFGLVGVFTVSFLGTSSLIVQHGLPSAWIIVAPMTVPLIVIAALAWREHPGSPSPFRSGGGTGEPDFIDPNTVDELLSRVIESPHGKGDTSIATTISAEDEVAQLARSIRQVAGSRARMSPARVSGIVEHLVRQDDGQTRPVTETRPRPRATPGELCSACVALAAGCLVVGAIGGLMPSALSAVVAGIIGSVVGFSVLPRWRGAFST